jgi:hypothetical protein
MVYRLWRLSEISEMGTWRVALKSARLMVYLSVNRKEMAELGLRYL